MEGNDSEKVDFNPKQNWKRSQSSDRSDFYSVLPARVGPSYHYYAQYHVISLTERTQFTC